LPSLVVMIGSAAEAAFAQAPKLESRGRLVRSSRTVASLVEAVEENAGS
jgi:hypothetical protein